MPYAYLKYIVYWTDSSIAQEGDLLISNAANSSWKELSTQISTTEDGHIKVDVINEDEASVWIDDFQITHTESPISQQTDYYPYGLEIAGT